MKIVKPCPECDGDEIYKTQVEAFGAHGPDLLPGIGHGFLGEVKLFDLYICGKCGYTQFFVEEPLLPQIPKAKNYTRV